jgi:outer membrane protein OmpA-like peptidoglycan-associated protein
VGNRRRLAGVRSSAGHTVTLGVTDLMTSLAVIFVLLLVVFINASRPVSAARSSEGAIAERSHNEVAGDPSRLEARAEHSSEEATAQRSAEETSARQRAQAVRAMLEESSPEAVAVQADPGDPQVLRVMIPDSLLNFEFGKSTLSPGADRFLGEIMPTYAVTLCGALRDRIAGVVIEGHTDDLGGDALNLRLSQERSLRVLIRSLDAIREAAPGAHSCFAELASASGRGKQDLVYDDQRRPDRSLSRRVQLKVLLRSSADGGATGRVSERRA